MKKFKKVSAIITTHNRIELLKKAIASVEKQTYKNMEIIVVDDCSTDGTRDYCLNNGRIKYIQITKEKHKNGNYARNLGIINSSGYYVAFLDDDDEWYDTKIEKQVQFLEENTNFELVSCLRKKVINNTFISYDAKKNNETSKYERQVFYEIIGTTSTYLATKKSVMNIGMFDENLNAWQDVEFITNMATHYKIGILNEHLTLYRRNLSDKKRISNGNIDKWLDAVKYINEKYKENIKKLPSEEKQKRELFILCDMASRYQKLGNKNKKKECLKTCFYKNKTFKNFIKYFFNVTYDDIAVLKLKLNRFLKQGSRS